ncbi:DUF3822 family protein [Parasediminibacterium sp. JCM 36343]|uniref:DUF3822 family protein n=1 Tax=Parasediminibacterium sp. JCM 36343 TaxID=3374279 RepID=UPI00397CAB41
MAKKVVSVYGDISIKSPFNSDQLIIEIGNYHIACLVKLSVKQELAAVEVYHFNSFEEEWYDIFQDVRSKSKILNRGFIDTRVFFNLPDTVLIPSAMYSEAAASEYLQLIHGDVINQVIKTDKVNVEPSITVATKIKRVLMDTVNSNLMMITVHNSYRVFLENLLATTRPYNHSLLKVQLYNNEMMVGLVYNNQLLLAQLYTQKTSEDILYHLLNVLQQYNLRAEETTLELSGMIEIKTALYENLKKVFPRITFDNPTEELIKLHDFTKYPKHYLTPYLNLL